MYNNQNTYVSASNSMLRSAFLYMALGLLITFLTPAYLLATGNREILSFVTRHYMAILVAEFIVVMVFSVRIYKVSLGVARIMFFSYAFLNGLTFTVIGLAIGDISIIAYALLTTVVMFGVTGLYGYMTHEDLGHYNSYVIGGIITIIIMSLINIFLHAPMIYWIVNVVGVVLFSALTAIDVNRIKAMSYRVSGGNDEMISKMGIMGALSLYLDFINLFLFILRIFSGTKNN